MLQIPEISIDRSNDIAACVKDKLDCISKRSNYQCIFQFLLTQRKENEEAYEPEVLSIGPYHHGKSEYQKLERYKLEYLQGILNRQNEETAKKYIDALLKVEDAALNCYSRDIRLLIKDKNDFLEMLLLDGCFIVEFLRKYSMDKEKLRDDPVFNMKWAVEILCRDLLLFENQLPFFILEILFKETSTGNSEENLMHLAIFCLNHCIAADGVSESSYDINQPYDGYHLLSLMYDYWCSSFALRKFEKNSNSLDQNKSDFSIITLQKVSSNLLQDEEVTDLEFIKSVSELEEHGIEFRKAKESSSWLQIKFENGVMEIPTLVVQDHTESILRNLIAYEEYMVDPRYYGKVVTDYTTLMNCLVNSSKDVKTLRHEKIIKSLLGNDEVLSDMFNRISGNVSLNCPWFSYRKLFEDVNKYCSKRRNQWIADLKKKYFNNPWSITAFLAATILLVLTLLQTIFSIQ